jgi:hypothetical protein
MGYSLKSASQPQGLRVSALADIVREVDVSPPSLYLFDRGEEPWLSDVDFIAYDALLNELGPQIGVYLREWYDDHDDEYRRSFWLAG